MRRVVAVAVVVVAAGLSWSTPASACSVTELPTEAQYVARADVVFEGTAVNRVDPKAGSPAIGTGDPITWTFAVDRRIKGSVAAQQVVQSARSGASCGFTFTVGTRYRVYGNYDGTVLRTGFPSGTREAPLVTATTAPRAVPPPASPPRRIALTG
jgi:hypothetical protein